MGVDGLGHPGGGGVQGAAEEQGRLLDRGSAVRGEVLSVAVQPAAAAGDEVRVGVSLDELAGTGPTEAPDAPEAGRRATTPLSFGDDKAVLPLTRYVDGLHAHKHVLPALQDPPTRPRQASHEGWEWLCVLHGRLWLALGDQDLVLTPGDVAEFDTRTPHGAANAGPGGPVEYLIMFGPQGERQRLRTPPAAPRHAGGERAVPDGADRQ
ncbi:cupin domain-containing protein [Streptomyces sp. NPDC053541]|uniref:cupin domain-containing protein n=1 Tax=Streptomyces sp. NPDC053541 TaxID=3365709 RepID=UPI0037D399BC